jgi:hypothetical protein
MSLGWANSVWMRWQTAGLRPTPATRLRSMGAVCQPGEARANLAPQSGRTSIPHLFVHGHLVFDYRQRIGTVELRDEESHCSLVDLLFDHAPIAMGHLAYDNINGSGTGQRHVSLEPGPVERDTPPVPLRRV